VHVFHAVQLAAPAGRNVPAGQPFEQLDTAPPGELVPAGQARQLVPVPGQYLFAGQFTPTVQVVVAPPADT
jgi:hypothetical protein